MEKLTIYLPEDWEDKNDDYKEMWLKKEYCNAKYWGGMQVQSWALTAFELVVLTIAVVALWMKALGVSI